MEYTRLGFLEYRRLGFLEYTRLGFLEYTRLRVHGVLYKIRVPGVGYKIRVPGVYKIRVLGVKVSSRKSFLLEKYRAGKVSCRKKFRAGKKFPTRKVSYTKRFSYKYKVRNYSGYNMNIYYYIKDSNIMKVFPGKSKGN